ncbi:peptidase U32 family protein [Pelosinus sp. sgz500959]|uniref:peptidase U32 family protein n=1 Tax=Pelosinus sp. sgz500959 TaxID=3242472 RepID=UPI00366D20BC
MLLKRNSVELLAPVGTWDVLEAAVESGADAVYLGGKRFNMRMLKTDANFDDKMLIRAIEYAHQHHVHLHVTVNNLISEREIPNMRSYLKFLDEIKPDALIVQDLSILQLAREMKLSVPLHASIMMNTHNEHAVRTLQDYGISRVVVNREMSLAQLALLKERTGIEVEYFIHGDMCISHSGQCVHSGVVFGQSSNRGRCLKSCRWPYELIDAATGKKVTDQDPGPYKLAMKDMCLYMKLPELIQSGVTSFKIEGRMRTAAFVKSIVQSYRHAIDSYIADPLGYTPNLDDWKKLQDSRARDFSTCYALGNPGASAIGYTGKREPRFFSQAVREADMSTPVAITSPTTTTNTKMEPVLSVRVADLPSLRAACQNGANIIYIGGEALKPATPWTLEQITQGITEANKYNAQVVVATPRITMERECGELEQFFTSMNTLRPHGLMVSNIGALRLARTLCDLPIQADFSFNIFNHLTIELLKNNGISKGTVSLEATHEQIIQLAKESSLPIEMIVHGSLPAMVTDHSIPVAILNNGSNTYDHTLDTRQYALLDTAGQEHLIMVDQYDRSHILFANDLCLLPHLQSLQTVQNYRIEGQHYTPEFIALLTSTYRQELDKIASQQSAYEFEPTQLEKIQSSSPRKLGLGTFRYRVSR